MAAGENRGVRRRCPICGLVKTFRYARSRVCSIPCEAKRRKAAGVFAKMQARSVATRMSTAPTELRGLGPLTPREQAIYMRGKRCGYESARAGALDRGFRKGYAAALGEQDEITWRKRRAA